MNGRSGGFGGWWLLPIAVAFALAPAVPAEAQAPAASASARVGYVDMKRLLDNAPQVISGRERLENEFAQRDTALKADEARLATLRERFERDGAVLTKDIADAQKREVDALERSIRRTREELRGELKTRSDQELDKSWQQINNAVVEYAREQGYDLIVPSPVVYASPRIDITDAVLERLKRDFQTSRR